MNVLPCLRRIVILTVEAANASETLVGPAYLSTAMHSINFQETVI
jgi:hypothetical protein